MSLRTLSGLRDAVRKFIDEKDEARWTDTELDIYINASYKFLVAEINNSNSLYYEKEGTVTTVSGTRTASLPADFSGTIVTFQTDENVPLNYISKHAMTWQETVPSERPTHYDFFGGESVIFWGNPDAIYAFPLVYLYAPADLSADGDTITFPINYEILIVLETVVFCKLKDHQKLTDAGGIYAIKKKEMLKNIQPKQKSRQSRVRCRYTERIKLN